MPYYPSGQDTPPAMAEALGLWWGDNKPISEMGMAGCHQIVVGTLSPYDRMLQTQQTQQT